MKRSRIETMHIILSLCTREIKKTHIMYRANLSHLQLEKYLEMLISKELLAKTDGHYVTTGRGLVFIEEFEKIQSVMGEGEKRGQRPSGIATFF